MCIQWSLETTLKNKATPKSQMSRKLTHFNMKKNAFVLIVILATSLAAQNLTGQGVYIRLGAGYGFSMSSQNVFTNYTSRHDVYENVYGSLGKGINGGLAFGFMFHKNIGFELGANYLMGGKVKGVDTYTDGTEEYTLSSGMIRVMPSIVISSGLEKIAPYARLGAVIGIGSIKYVYTDTWNDGDNVFTSTMKMNKGIGIGLNAALGVMFNLSSSIAIYGELATVNMTYAPTKGELTECSLDGENILDDLNTRDKEVDFVDSYEYDDDPPNSKPDQELKTKFPFGSIGANVGIQVNF
jgi:hypothetical protein